MTAFPGPKRVGLPYLEKCRELSEGVLWNFGTLDKKGARNKKQSPVLSPNSGKDGQSVEG